MTTTNYIAHLVLSVVLIVGVYQFYFWCQRNALTDPRELTFSIDRWIPFWPTWVWVYSFLYYPAILGVNLIIESSQQFIYMAISYMLLLALQMVLFLTYPVTTPKHWRQRDTVNGISEKFLAFVQRFDAPSNSFPSMHTSVATLTAFHLYSELGAITFLFPTLIGVSCLFTKQHYFIDIPAGALLGWVSFTIYLNLM